MSDNKKYYYMRLKENFFESDEMKVLESMKDGYLYSNILLKLYLKSLKGNGKLMFNDAIPYNSSMISTVTGHQVGTVEKALNIFKEMRLIEVMDSGAIYMLNIHHYIGKASTEADRIRKYRKQIDEENSSKKHIPYICTPEIEKEIEIEKDIDIECTNTPAACSSPKKKPAPKEQKEKNGEFGNVLLTSEEKEKLIVKYGEKMTETYIEKLSAYLAQTGKRYKSHYATILNWIRKEAENKQEQKNSSALDYKNFKPSRQ